jgi:hypothetical protein
VAISGGELLPFRPRAPLVVVPRSAGLQAAEDSLRLVANVAGTRLQVSTTMLREHLQQHFGLQEEEFDVRRHFPEDFVVRFRHGADQDRVLHSRRASALPLVWYPWRRTTLAHHGSFKFRVLLALSRVPLHARSTELAQHVLGPACANIEESQLRDREDDDDREYFITAWCKHPAFVVDRNLVFIPEPVVPGIAPADDHLDGLMYLIKVRLVAFQDFSSPPGSPAAQHVALDGWAPAAGLGPHVQQAVDERRVETVRSKTPRGRQAELNTSIKGLVVPSSTRCRLVPIFALLVPALGGARWSLPRRWRRLRRRGARLCLLLRLLRLHHRPRSAFDRKPLQGQGLWAASST